MIRTSDKTLPACKHECNIAAYKLPHTSTNPRATIILPSINYALYTRQHITSHHAAIYFVACIHLALSPHRAISTYQRTFYGKVEVSIDATVAPVLQNLAAVRLERAVQVILQCTSERHLRNAVASRFLLASLSTNLTIVSLY